jgi:hypothetical protein
MTYPKLGVGSVVTFQYIEHYDYNGVDCPIARHAEGVVQAEYSGLFRIQLLHTNIIVNNILPDACRPTRFSRSKLMLFIRDYVVAYEAAANAGRFEFHDAEKLREDVKLMKKKLQEFIGWLA